MTFARHALPLLLIAVCNTAFADPSALRDDAYDIPAVKTTSAPKVDGTIEVGEYPAEARREGFSDLDTNLTADEFAEFWLTYDDEFIYFAGRVKTDPKKVVRDEYRPNSSVGGNDNFGLRIDPYGANSNFNTFQTNANGATSIYLAGGRAAKTEWLGEIEANGRLTETGWECEMRIPWSIMSLPSSGKRDVRFNISWFRTNKQNTYTYRYTGQNNELTPTWTQVDVPAVSRARTISFLPYAFGGVQEGRGPIANAGLDFKTGLTDSIQFVGTINPDFRNVESSILSLDFSYFERLASENRPFFNEGADFLRVGYSTRLFASQRIPSFDAGFNAYGQIDKNTTFGALTTLDFGERAATVVSASHRFDDKNSMELGVVNNSQRGANSLGGLANYFTRTGDVSYFLTNQFTTDQTRGAGWRNNVGMNYGKGGFNSGVEYLSITPDFFPRIGFNRESDLKGYIAFAETEITPAHGFLDAYDFAVSAETYDYFTGGFYRNNFGWSAHARDRQGIAFGIASDWSQFKGVADHTFGIGAAYPVTDPYRNVSFNYSDGTFFGEKFQNYQVDARYRFFNRLQMYLSSQFQLSTEDQTQHIFSVNYDLGKYESIGGRLVYLNGRSNWYLSYRLSGKLGAEYFLLIGDPRADSFTDRIVLKAVLPFSIKY